MDHRELKPYKKLGSREVYANRWIRVSEDSVEKPDGSLGIFGVVRMKAGSTVVALTEDEQVYLVREYKYAIAAVSLEAISGGLDGNETPLEGAKRELEEELGIHAERWTDLGTVNPFTTVINSPNHMFLAEGISIGADHPDEGEDLAKMVVPFTTALGWVMDGTIAHGASCVALLKTARLLDERRRMI